MSAAFITTVKERCRMCYTCVRECPAKAIRIADGQAEVIARALHRLRQLRARLLAARQAGPRARSTRCETLLALRRSAWRPAWRPVFPPSSPTSPTRSVVGMLRALGFRLVVGGVLRGRSGRPASTASCWRDDQRPPLHLHHLPGDHRLRRTLSIPTWSARWRRSSRRWSPRPARCAALHGDDLKIVFIGPCIAKKVEARMRRSWPARSTPC